MKAAPALRTVLFGHSYIDQECARYSFNRPMPLVRGTFMWANRLLDGKLSFVGERGIGGERVRDWIKRMQENIGALNPGIVIVSDPINDLKNTTNPGYLTDRRIVELPYLIEGYQQVIDYITNNLEAYCVILAATPPNPAETVTLGTRVALWNRWAMKAATNNRRVRYSPVNEPLINAASASGLVTNASTGTAVGYYDAIHPNIMAAYARGKVLANTLSRLPEVPEWTRLINTIGEAMLNQTITVTSFVCNGDGTATVLLSNGSLSEIRTGDLCTFWNDSALSLNGTYRVLAHSTTSITVACSKTGSVSTGVMKASACTQIFGNPLFLTTTGGTKGGTGSARIVGNVPNLMSVFCDNASVGCTITLSTASHTDRSGNADGFGNWLVLDCVVDAATNVQVSMFGHRGSLTASAVFGRLAAGDVISSMLECEVVGGSGGTGNPSGLKDINYNLSIAATPPGASQVFPVLYDMLRDGTVNDNYPQEKWRGVMDVPEYRLPADFAIDSIDCNFNIVFSGAGAAQIRIARASFHKLAPELSIRGGDVDSYLAIQ